MNPTQVAGLLAFGCASVACFMVAPTRRWQALGALNALFAVEILLSLRHRLHDRADVVLRSFHAYDGRGSWQWMLLAAAVIAVLLVGYLTMRGRRWTGGLKGACVLSLLAAGLFVMESVSLHSVDALLYRQFDGLMLIGWLWLAIGVGVVSFALTSRSGSTFSRAGARRRKRR